MPPERVTFEQFARRYCDRQDSTPERLLAVLKDQRDRFECSGWFLAEAQLLDSSWAGNLVILPYGDRNTFKSVPDHPFSPRGLASDTSVAVSYLEVRDLPAEIAFEWTAPPKKQAEPKARRKHRKKTQGGSPPDGG